MKDDLIRELNDRFAESTVEEVLQYFLNEYKGRIAFASSLGAEDQVLTHMIREIAPDAKIFTLDTGRMFQETYDLIDRTNARYKMKMEIYFPDYKQVENMVNDKGMNLFYESVENRKLCCHIRKIEPLHRALEGSDIWITGLRKEQSVTRNNNNLLELDENNHGRLKLNPLINWSEDEVWDFINKHKVPYNTLHDQGFQALAVCPVPALSSLVKMYEPAGGGGKCRSTRSVGYIKNSLKFEV
ncbi:MAG: phosphoadenylyl-sulfate reductase [Bacteroidales bacterium]